MKFEITLGTTYNGKWFGGLYIKDHWEKVFSPDCPGITHENRYWMLNHWICVLRRVLNSKGLWMDTENVRGVCLENGEIKEVIKIVELKGQKVYQICTPSGQIREERSMGEDVVFIDTGLKTHRPMESMEPPIQTVSARTPVKKSNAVKKPKKTPGAKSKKDLVLELFQLVGETALVEEVIEHSGFDLKNLKTFIAIQKNPKKTKPENIKVFEIAGDIMKWIQ